MRRLPPVALALLLPVCGLRAQDPEPPQRFPNIVVLYADDAGYADFGFQQHAAKDMAKLTPHIDSIARDGVRFTDAYMSGCVCSPSRAGLLTGRYQTRFGHEQNIPPGYMEGGMSLDERTVADRLRKLGYRTGLVGKWHLGYPKAYHPNERGFDWFYGLLQGSRGYEPLRRPGPHRVIQEDGTPTKEGGYVTDRFGDAAVRFIRENKDGAFFLFVSFTAPHGPLQAKDSDLARLGHIAEPRRRKYAGLVKCLDDNVGKVLAALKEHGLAKDTLVVFTNDNGGQTLTGADNGPLRGRKGTLYEGGVRVPMCMRLPGRIEAGSTIDDPVIALDLLPTFVAFAGGEADNAWKLDGHDLSSRILGQVLTTPRRTFFWRKGGPGKAIAMRQGNFKLVCPDRGAGEPFALYDLGKDIGETTDLAATRQDVVTAMRKRLDAWEREQVAPLWGSGR